MKTSKAAEVWPAKAAASKEDLSKSPLRVKEESRKAKEAYIAWRKNCTILLERPAINNEPSVDTDCKRSVQTDSNNHSKDKKTPTSEQLTKMFEFLGVSFEFVPITYLGLLGFMPAEEVKAFIESRCKKKQIDLRSSLSPRKAYKLIDALQTIFPELHRYIAAVYEGALEIEFSQGGFSGTDTLSREDLCYPLTLKWLADQGTGQVMDFFNDINTCEGRKELMSLVESHDSVGRYMRGRGLAWEDKSTERFEKIEGDGKYFIKLIDRGSKTIGHAMGAFVDRKSSFYFMFDPNRGVFSFNSEHQINSFLDDYSRIFYRGLRKGRLRLVCNI
ncbi:hypothetical protein [Pseudomonas chlororaphis]|uniref:Cysteine protease domain, YopT-type n=1 Tax=Pseudomonas chlororaphis TaxID=587753 RepID=A0AAX3FPP7_9PSED|nr:hypothetical protein [Pseudomonas chlororaphis]AZC38210.1 hypothetical protein C4K37_3825 [Pseudomonas chlororaphis subsp. piscium]AZC44758.1 hypothetical protein C4K36_3835 [Pseudomonas chlororaphis subsp. piscium]WDG70364.1 hypothetical protein PUP65_19835 [Pseudomonas chlororaphis]WDH31849.1 hypothetical protein PUP81_14485 [Pseudomonas chlororaphis]WDH68890.1 hypothetical protein PUP78_19820 [Pseudomonas chlororaphis]